MHLPGLKDTLSPRVLRRCYSYLRPYWRITAGAYLAILAINSLNVAVPQFIRWIIDRGIAQRDIALLAWSVAGLLGLTLFKGIFTYLQGQWTEVASQSVAYDLRNAIQHKLTRLPFAYHDHSESGQLLSRALQDAERIRFLTGRATLRVVDGLVLFIATTAVLLWMNPRLALLLVAILPFIGVVALRFGGRFRPLSLILQDQLGVMTTRLEQNLRGARVVKAFAQEKAETARFNQQNERWFDLSARAAWLQAINLPLMDLIAHAGLVVVIWYGGLLVIRGQITLGELVAFSTYVGQLTQPVRVLGMVIPAIAMASSAAERIFEILDTPAEVQDAPDASPLPPVRGHVQFEAVSFGYDPRRMVLKEVSFDTQPGQIVALLGATGAGKSTVINLIPRFYDPSAGRVLIDGHDGRCVTLHSLRRQIGIVLQETILFAATVRENIAYGRPEASQAEIIEAARAAQAHDFIVNQLPDGYDTHVGEKGVTLSGGQKQRLAIARALLTDPRILILDDATASVDTGTERQIQQALDHLMENRTTFIIAHRLSTVRRADLVLLLDKGRLVAQGNHEELWQRSKFYREIYRRQLQPDDAAEPTVAARGWLALPAWWPGSKEKSS